VVCIFLFVSYAVSTFLFKIVVESHASSAQPDLLSTVYNYSLSAMAFNCLDVDKLDPTIWNDVCVASDFLYNETAWQMTQDALKICCGPNNFFVTDDDCYTYCNITTPFDTVMMQNCLEDTMAPNFDWGQLEWDCYPFAWELSSTADTSAGLIATTWTYPDNTFALTETLSNGIVVVTTETDNYLGTPLTAITTASTKAASPSATGSTATKTADSKSSTGSSTSAGPTSSKTTSGAGGRIRLSYGAGTLVALSFVALVL
jgi:hypothetical protein